jgi:hypothetical protein
MCELCGTNAARTYTHSRTSHHFKLLLKLFKDIKEKKIQHPLSQYYY